MKLKNILLCGLNEGNSFAVFATSFMSFVNPLSTIMSCTYRGIINVKSKRLVEMYFIDGKISTNAFATNYTNCHELIRL